MPECRNPFLKNRWVNITGMVGQHKSEWWVNMVWNLQISYRHYAKKRNSCGAPYANIAYMNLDKQLDFPCDTPIEKYSRVYIETSKGYFGFDIIANHTLIEGQW
jgi:hypothetical protein